MVLFACINSAFVFVSHQLLTLVVLFSVFYFIRLLFLLFTIFCHFLFTRLLDKQDILAPDQPYDGPYGQGPPSVHSNQDGGRSYRQGIVELVNNHYFIRFRATRGAF